MPNTTTEQDIPPPNATKTEDANKGDSSILNLTTPSMFFPPNTEPFDQDPYNITKEAPTENMSAEESLTILISDTRPLNSSWLLGNTSDGNESDAGVGEGVAAEGVPLEMVFNSSHIITIAAYSCLFFFSALGNISVLKSIAGHRWRTSTSRVTLMILHLTIADLLVTFLLMPLEIGWAWTVSWEAGDLACRVLAFFRTFGVFLSGFLLIVISVDRYHAVLRPLTVTEAKRRVRIMLWGAWTASGVFSLPQAVIFHVETHPKHEWFRQCVTFNSFATPTQELLYNVSGFIAMYALPLATIIFCYGSIVIALYRKDLTSREGRGGSGGGNDGGGGGGGGGGGAGGGGVSLGRAKTRTLTMTLTIVTVFFLCWTPYNVMSLWYFIDRNSAQTVDPRIQAALFIFAVANSTVNPLVYGYFNVRRTGRTSSLRRQEWRMKRVVYKPPFRRHLPDCMCNTTQTSSSDLHPHHHLQHLHHHHYLHHHNGALHPRYVPRALPNLYRDTAGLE